MKITCFIYILLLTTFSVLQAEPASAQLLRQRISVSYSEMSLHQIILDLQERTGTDFGFTGDLGLDKIRIKNMRFENRTLEDILLALFKGHSITFEEKAGAIILSRSRQPRTISGRVTDEQGGFLPGATIMVRDLEHLITTTDNEGRYSLNVPGNAEALLVTYLGYKPQEVPIGERTTIDIQLVPDMESLENVIVTGYRKQARGTVTGAVSSLNSSEFKDIPVDNLSNALSGRLPGVTISQAAGTPGMTSGIRVRAIGTFNNASPLYVIDGVVRDKFAFDALTPNEVESISVLKDGASASIYGSRAANGVILVTTKRGTNQPPRLSYQSTVGIQTPTQIPESLNAYEHATLINDALAYHYYYNDDFVVPEDDVRLYTRDELDYFKEHSWNWVDELWQTPVTTQHALNVQGGSDRVRYFLGGSYIYSIASFENLDYRKFNLRGNIDVDITKNLTASLDLNTDNRLTRGPNWGVNDWKQEDLYKNLVNRPQLMPPYINGELVGNWTYWSPAAVMDREIAGYNDTEWTGLNATIALDYKVPFVDGLGVNVKYNRYRRDQFIKRFSLPYDMTLFNTVGTHNHILGEEPVGINTRPLQEFLLNRSDRDKSYQFNVQLDYNKTFGKHNLDALFVYEQTESTVNWFQGRRDNFLSQSIDQFVGGGRSVEEQRANGAEHESARLSYVGSVNYDYNNKYLLQASFRYDGSVIFAPENRWGFFPSGSLGWRISNEPFFNAGFINDLMIRASVGLVGNDNVGSFQWLQSVNIVDGAAFDGVTAGLEPGTLANRDITWEKSLSYNAGVDARFWNNKVNLKADLFHRHTYDILLPRVLSVPTTFGASLPDENYAEVNTRGFEVDLGYNGAFGSGDNQVSYRIRGNFGYSTNEIVKVDVGENARPYESKIGRPIGLADNYAVNLNGTDMLFGLVATDIIRRQEDLDALPEGYTIFGEAPQLGMLNYRDIRGPNSDEPDGRITNDDREYLGKYSIPPLNYGLSLGASWKSLSIDVLFQGVGGHQVMLHPNARQVQGRADASSYRFWKDHWTIDNPDAAYPAVTDYDWPATNYPASSWFVRNGSFLRLKNLTVSYQLPKGILRTKGVRLFYTGTNLLLLFDHMEEWGYDPEASNIRAYPIMTTHSFGLNIDL